MAIKASHILEGMRRDGNDHEKTVSHHYGHLADAVAHGAGGHSGDEYETLKDMAEDDHHTVDHPHLNKAHHRLKQFDKTKDPKHLQHFSKHMHAYWKEAANKAHAEHMAKANRFTTSQHSEVNDGSLTDVAPADDWGKSNHVSDDVARSIIEERYGKPAVSQHAEMINTPGGKLAANHSAILAGHGYKKTAHDKFGSEHAKGEHVVRITNEGHWLHTKNNKEVNDGHGSQSLYDHLAKVHGRG